MTNTLSIAVSGSGGSGAVTAGSILLEAVASMGYYALLARSAGPQIRGGESAAMLRIGTAPVSCMSDRFELLVALDWRNVERFIEEIPLGSDSLVLADSAPEDLPAVIAASGAGVLRVAFGALAAEDAGGRMNMVAIGAAGRALGLPLEALGAGAEAGLARKGSHVVRSARASLERGYRAASSGPQMGLDPAVPNDGRRWNISGNEACGAGALRAGVRFVAAYPITPATEMLEWLAPRLERLGGSLLQAEDELASINMAIGASFGGVPALTATSGPGLSLMSEGLGLAVASETPLVVVDVMRGGPSTGVPTKSEQSDLNIAVYGLHGDAPHLVLAPLGIEDCVLTTQWASGLAERLQVPAIVLSDQSLGQARAIVDAPGAGPLGLSRRIAVDGADSYRRYELSADGVSPMALPGTPGCMYTADGLEHDEAGLPSSAAADHARQSEKRRRKLTRFDYGELGARIQGAGGSVCLVTWGSTAGAVEEAAHRLTSSGEPALTVALRLLAPLPCGRLREAMTGASRVIVVELNEGAQLFRYLHAERVLPETAESYARPGPLPIRPGEIVRLVREESRS